ncbi:MAG: hypothetical protein A3H98_14195 [Bacteroidetes bacterium RIFCSPLOWO2_02_FULL_36_8]|nr:MAG: hypothetical protein A3H98_14195 [Bacteroidetes bacterium RIFCSPLOWO2_02_FULL_36_8]OFY69119.1 MAG: hypothetical protein A3G23_06105 [Bacteroidetes bacterium RIFCSPLOWO2_12_FULL_37_12]
MLDKNIKGEPPQVEISYIFDLHKSMIKHKLLLVYEGEFSQELTTSLLSMTEKKIDLVGEDMSIKRKIFYVMMECLQNVCKHSQLNAEKKENLNAIFMIGRDENEYYIYTGNFIEYNEVDALNEKLTKINNLDEVGLKNLYKEMLQNSRLSDRGGAGLGLVDIARKSGSKLYFDFNPVDGTRWFYSLQVKINRNNPVKNVQTI